MLWCSSNYVWIWELDHKEGWMLKNWCFWTVVLEKTLESPLDCKGLQPVHPKGNQSWIFIGRTDAEAETPILWLHDVKNWLIGKDPDAGKDLRWEEKGTTEDEIVGWHHQLNKHNREQALEMVKDREAWSAANHEVVKSQTQLSDWTTTTTKINWGLPWWSRSWESTCWCKGHGFDPCSQKISLVAGPLSPWATAVEAHLL